MRAALLEKLRRRCEMLKGKPGMRRELLGMLVESQSLQKQEKDTPVRIMKSQEGQLI
jgi:hypothetical protein